MARLWVTLDDGKCCATRGRMGNMPALRPFDPVDERVERLDDVTALISFVLSCCEVSSSGLAALSLERWTVHIAACCVPFFDS